MDNTLLVSLSQQLAAYRSMDVIANNLANVSTPASSAKPRNSKNLSPRSQPSEGQTGPQTVSFVKDTGVVRDLSEGGIGATGAPFDLAINGNGYFVGADAARQTLHPQRPSHARRRRPDCHRRRRPDAWATAARSPSRPTTATSISRPTARSAASQGQIGKLRLVDFADEQRAEQRRRQPLLDRCKTQPRRPLDARSCKARWNPPTSSR